MNNSLKITHILRNVIMIISIITMIIIGVFYPNNMLYAIFYCLICAGAFVLSYFLMYGYRDYLFLKKNDLKEFVDYYDWRKYLLKFEKDELYNALLWLGDESNIESYLKNNSLTLSQRISYSLYDLDKSIFAIGDERDYSSEIKRITGLLAHYEDSCGKDDLLKRWHLNLEFYEKYLQGENDAAKAILEELEPDSSLVQMWIDYHELMICKRQGDKAREDELLNGIKAYKCDTRFHKWLGLTCENDNHAKCISMWVLFLTICVFAVFIFHGINQKYDSVEKALKSQYNVRVQDENIIYDFENTSDGICVYECDSEMIYAYYSIDDSKYRIEEVYKYYFHRTDDEDTNASVGAIVIGQLKDKFYSKIQSSIPKVAVTETDEFDFTIFPVIEIKKIERMNNGYYLVYIE